MNKFCLDCTGGNKGEVLECKDENCPFWRSRRFNLKHQLGKNKKVALGFVFDGNIASGVEER